MIWESAQELAVGDTKRAKIRAKMVNGGWLAVHLTTGSEMRRVTTRNAQVRLNINYNIIKRLTFCYQTVVFT